MKRIVLIIGLLFLLCACSDNEEKYDDLLSYTEWHCFYVETWSRVPDVEYEFEGLDDVLSKLESTKSKVETCADTIWDEDISVRGDQWLLFGNESCKYVEERVEESSYVVNDYKVTKVYYPDQSYEEDLGDGYYLYIILEGKIISITRKHYDYVEYNGKMMLDEPNIRHTEIRLLSSEEFPYEKREAKQYDMTFDRDDRSVILSGELNITGYLNEEMDEISLADIGTLYKE